MSHSVAQSDLQNVLISLLGSNAIGCETVALAGELIAANARFNNRVADAKFDKTKGDEEFFQYLDLADCLSEECEVAVRNFASSGDRDELNRVLMRIAVRFNVAAR